MNLDSTGQNTIAKTNSTEEHVVKRNGRREPISFDKITNRIKKLGGHFSGETKKLTVNYTSLAMKIIERLYDGIGTTEIDELTSQLCASLSTKHPDYAKLASRVLISNHHKNTSADFFKVVTDLYEYRDIHGVHHPIVSKELMDTVSSHKDTIQKAIVDERDYLIDYFGFKTLERAYLMKINGNIVERPQHMWMRVALGIHGEDLDKAIETYHLMSQKYFTHATPTLFHSGTPRPQLSSCYLIAMQEDSITGIYDTLADCAAISKWAGGIGLHIHNVRAAGSHIRGTNGTSNGIVPMLKVFNNTARYVDQCVHPETYIYTTEGPKQIQFCEAGKTEIFGQNGKKEVIGDVLEHSYEGKILNIHNMHSIEPLRVTEEHPLLVLRNQKKGVNYETIKKRLENGTIRPEWLEAKELSEDDFLVYSVPCITENNESDDTKHITKDDCYLYGVILGDGCINNKNTGSYISLHSENKRHILDFLKKYFEEHCIEYTIQNSGPHNVRFYWKKNVAFKFRYSDFYSQDSGGESYKRFNPKFLNLPVEKAKYILKGLIDTDGCKHNELTFDTTSRNLLESLRFLCMRMGILTSGYIRDRVGEKHVTKYGDTIENKKISYCLRIPKTQEIAKLVEIDGGEFQKFFRHENLLFSRIKEKMTMIEEYNGVLYDLQMKKEHNYMIHNGLIHNGGGKRHGSFAIYLEPWHSDIRDFLDMKKNHGDEEARARDLFYALWIPDLFMKRVKENGKWTLMCPDKCPGLSDAYGDDFVELYEKYEKEGRGNLTLDARDIWFKILDSQIETGTPYMLYKDACNKKSNQKNLGTIKSSNLCCVKGDTLLLTDKGHLKIETLRDQTVSVWNGKEFSEVTVRQTRDDEELVDVNLSDGSKLTCTKYHKFYIQEKYPISNSTRDIIHSKNVKLVEAKDLIPGMKLIKCEYPTIDSKKTLENAYTNGFFSGDGTYMNKHEETKKCEFKALDGEKFCKRHINHVVRDEINDEAIKEGENKTEDSVENKCQADSYAKRPHVSLYGEKIKLLEHLDYISTGKEKGNKLNVTLSMNLEEKFFVPMNYSLESKMEWFAGYCDADGCISKNGENQSLQISCIHKDFLLNIKLMLQTCGISSKVTLCMDEKNKNMPDGKGGEKTYNCKKLWRILISSNELQKMLSMGFNTNRLIVNKHEPQRSATHFVKIDSIEDNGERDKTYCFTEHQRHAGIFNGVITSQCEIVEYSNSKETAVCNLASIALSKFVKEDKTYDYEKLHEIVKIVTRNLNKVIDINFYPTEKTKRSNQLHRPVGMGVQGLADAFALMDLPFHSEEAKEVNRNIFETIYHAALEASNEISKNRSEMIRSKKLIEVQKLRYWHEYAHGDPDYPDNIARQIDPNELCEQLRQLKKRCPEIPEEIKRRGLNYLDCDLKLAGSYSSFIGSPASKGILQFDMWGVEPSKRYDWDALKENIKKYGLRNSLLVAPMPTASTSQILGNNECFEPFTSNIYVRRTLAGEFVMINKYLLEEMIEKGKWTEEVKNSIIANNGSVQHLDISQKMKDKYRTVWEIPMKFLIEMARDRGAYVCQSQSMNLWMQSPTYDRLTAMHFFSWSQGLKTGLYYLRSKAKAAPQQFTIDPKTLERKEEGPKNEKIDDAEEEECLMCGS